MTQEISSEDWPHILHCDLIDFTRRPEDNKDVFGMGPSGRFGGNNPAIFSAECPKNHCGVSFSCDGLAVDFFV